MKFVFEIPLKFLQFHLAIFTNLRKGEIPEHYRPPLSSILLAIFLARRSIKKSKVKVHNRARDLFTLGQGDKVQVRSRKYLVARPMDWK